MSTCNNVLVICYLITCKCLKMKMRDTELCFTYGEPLNWGKRLL
uniref:Uncharacterized protein n=1 Tax=Anguilla anguilla TaxID=7936 RepID=A0A0E9WC49_ANGAN